MKKGLYSFAKKGIISGLFFISCTGCIGGGISKYTLGQMYNDPIKHPQLAEEAKKCGDRCLEEGDLEKARASYAAVGDENGIVRTGVRAAETKNIPFLYETAKFIEENTEIGINLVKKVPEKTLETSKQVVITTREGIEKILSTEEE